MIGAAGPVDGEMVRLTNVPWTINRADVSRKLGNHPVGLFNDLQAVAL